ncbi:MAG: DUF2712 domain-containing protein [Eubacterium sp.]|nr:DUF2712 domain-containing protein [Eubacterium sp.]
MNKQKKLVKKLSTLFVMLILSVTVLSTTAASAATAKIRVFNFDIPAKGELCHSKYSYYRNTDSVLDGWGIILKYSDEPYYTGITVTKFWLGIDNPNGTNPMGSQKFNVAEGTGWHSYSAYNEANRKNVFLYASDNSQSNDKYSTSGQWTPNYGEPPEN